MLLDSFYDVNNTLICMIMFCVIFGLFCQTKPFFELNNQTKPLFNLIVKIAHFQKQ